MIIVSLQGRFCYCHESPYNPQVAKEKVLIRKFHGLPRRLQLKVFIDYLWVDSNTGMDSCLNKYLNAVFHLKSKI